MYFFEFTFLITTCIHRGFGFPEVQTYWRFMKVVDIINMNFHKDIVWFNLSANYDKWTYNKGVSGEIDVKRDLNNQFEVI